MGARAACTGRNAVAYKTSELSEGSPPAVLAEQGGLPFVAGVRRFAPIKRGRRGALASDKFTGLA